MKSQIKLLTLLSMLLLLYGCDSNQYQIVTGPDGALYRFDKKTGSLSAIIKDKSLVQPAQPQKSEIIKEDHGPALDKPVSWKESRYPGKDLKASRRWLNWNRLLREANLIRWPCWIYKCRV